VKKKDTIIINPGILSDLLLKNKHFNDNHNVHFINLNSKSVQEFDQKLKKCNLIIIDNLEASSINEEYISLLNYYRVFESKIINVTELFEIYYNRIPVIKLSNGWIASKDLLNIKISRHIEFSKRIFDTTLIFLFSPIILLLILIGAILIKIFSKGPIFFKQERVGKNGKPFLLYKLRTMVHTKDGYFEHTQIDDVRIFPIGKFLRFTKIDELPQCLNVLLGHMSIIGPRPEKTDIVKKLDEENPYYELRHLIRPGITGWAQVNNPVATPQQNFEKLEYDLYYIKNANLALEINIIIKTIKIIINRNSL
jgi:lipopolysaccharide/colanic/teichoic acid biosynthesis glycosyltransferase